MRCFKCGFISFDHLTSCSKCGKDTAEVASELQGTSIKVETPMFLGPALAAFAEREASFEEHAMEAEVDEGIDFSMEDGDVGEEAIEIAAEEENIDFSFEDETVADTSLKTEKAENAAAFSPAVEVEEKASPEAAEESFEELDIMGTVDEEEGGGLEFDLEDFIDDMDDDKQK